MKAITPTLKQLVDKQLDGTLQAGEQEKLQQMLSESEEVRLYATQMEILHRSLQQAGEEKVCIDISGEVMDRVRTGSPNKKQAKIIRLSSRIISNNRQLMKYAAILLAGLLLGSAATLILLKETADTNPDHMSATISGRSLPPLIYKEDAWGMQIQPVVSADRVVLMINLQSSSPASMTLHYDQQVYRLESTRYLSYDTIPEASSHAGLFQIASEGNQVFHLLFKRHPDMPSPMVIDVMQNGTIIYQREILMP
jgi:hypothetical protein